MRSASMTASAVSAGWILKTPKPSCGIVCPLLRARLGTVTWIAGSALGNLLQRSRLTGFSSLFSVRGGELIDAVGADDVRLTVSSAGAAVTQGCRSGRFNGRRFLLQGLLLGLVRLQPSHQGTGNNLLPGRRPLRPSPEYEADSPMKHGREPVLEADEVHDVNDEPHDPREETGEPDLADAGDRVESRDGRHAAFVEVLEGRA